MTVPLPVYVLATGLFAMVTSEFTVAGLMPQLADGLDTGIEQIGYLVTVFAAAMTIGGPLLAFAVMRLQARPALVLVFGVFLAGNVLAALATGYSVMVCARVVGGAASQAFSGIAMSMAVRMVDERARGRAVAVVMNGLMLGTLLGLPLATFVGGMLGWRAAFGVISVMTSGANGALQVITVHLQDDLGMPAAPAGAMLLVSTLPFVVLGPVSERLVTRWGRRSVAATGFAVGGTGLLTLGRLPGIIGVVPGLLAVGVGLGLMTAAIVGETLAAWPTRPGLAGGLNNAMRQLGTSVGAGVGAALTSSASGAGLLERAGSVSGVWWLCGAVVTVIGFARTAPSPRRIQESRVGRR